MDNLCSNNRAPGVDGMGAVRWAPLPQLLPNPLPDSHTLVQTIARSVFEAIVHPPPSALAAEAGGSRLSGEPWTGKGPGPGMYRLLGEVWPRG